MKVNELFDKILERYYHHKSKELTMDEIFSLVDNSDVHELVRDIEELRSCDLYEKNKIAQRIYDLIHSEKKFEKLFLESPYFNSFYQTIKRIENKKSIDFIIDFIVLMIENIEKLTYEKIEERTHEQK